jgi:hypothetical protein
MSRDISTILTLENTMRRALEHVKHNPSNESRKHLVSEMRKALWAAVSLLDPMGVIEQARKLNEPAKVTKQEPAPEHGMMAMQPLDFFRRNAK